MEKNILFITNLHLWSLEKGKGGRAFINTVEGYKKAGWNIWFISTGGGIPSGIISEEQLFENSYPFWDKLYRSSSRFISILARFCKLFLINRYYWKIGNSILKNYKGEKIIIYAYEVHGVRIGKKLSMKFGQPLVTRFQGTVHSETPNTGINLIKKAPYLSAYKTSGNLTIMTNDGTKGREVLNRFNNGSKKILFWRNGVNKVPQELLLEKKNLKVKFNLDKNFVFLTVSRLVNWKRVDRAINSFSELLKNHPNEYCKLVVIGDGPEISNLKELSRKLSIEDRVLFLGAIEQKEIYSYMVAADVFLSLYDLSNVGNPLMEAMMCAKPIITIDVGDTKELIRNNENGILLQLSTLQTLHSHMWSLVQDKSFREAISKAAFNDANSQFWTWDERISAEIIEVSVLLP